MRPIVFDEALAHERDDVVLVHLNHRLAQLCLGLLRAELWAPEDRLRALRRVSARVVPDAILSAPAVVAFARLIVLGNDNSRLHEELMTAGGRFREGKLVRMNASEVETALAQSFARRIPRTLHATLTSLWPKHREVLLSALESRGEERHASLEKVLAKRAQKDSDDVGAILTELQTSIQAAIGTEPVQLSLFTTPEREQFERNRDALMRRAEALPAEIQREQAAIRKRYDRPTIRLFPAAVIYLVPESMTKNAKGDA
jgi:carboxylesterase type B